MNRTNNASWAKIQPRNRSEHNNEYLVHLEKRPLRYETFIHHIEFGRCDFPKSQPFESCIVAAVATVCVRAHYYEHAFISALDYFTHKL